MHPETLRPLLERGPAPQAPEQVRAMPVILRIEKAEPPARTALLEAAASAAVAVCLDDRTAEDGPWHRPVHDWLDVQIRKVARRARGAHWRAAAELPGITVDKDGAQARALLPHLVDEAPQAVRRLQVGGTELPSDTPGAPRAGEPVLWLNPTVPMTLGKAAAQVGHASMLLAAAALEAGELDWIADWAARGYPCAVRTATAEWAALEERAGTVAVQDAGYTEVDPGTVTVRTTLAS
ncbi:peptidyl-tRNA hydrolase [Sciscionella marina]|uniref:peptidyl-tRNA hydrolase n=1 Tax=Sciscionella marina TaxID=508770 RepID=UPI00037FC64B|nr:peptidyl-tRNA hydrolase [Sciscionella marina]